MYTFSKVRVEFISWINFYFYTLNKNKHLKINENDPNVVDLQFN